MPFRRTTPEERAKRQLKALRASTRRTIKALTKDPSPQQATKLLEWYDERIEKIGRPGSTPQSPLPSPYWCMTCQRYHHRYVSQEWHLPAVLHWPWAVGVTAVFLLVVAFFEWWAFCVFPVAWLVSFSFFWSIVVPALLLAGVLVVLAATGI
jgi:hypothetical protein